MKKIFPIVIIIIVVLSGFGVTGATTIRDRRVTNNLDISISFPCIDEYQITSSKSGQKIELNGYNYLLDTGKPMLPSKTILIAIPPGSIIQSVDFHGIEKTQISGTYRIIPSSFPVPYENTEQNQAVISTLKTVWQKNYNTVYSSDDAFPPQIGTIIGSGTLRKYSYVAIMLYPVQYHPESGRLYTYTSAQIVITYALPSTDSETTQSIEDMKEDTHADQQAANLFINYNDIKNLYQPKESHPTGQKNIDDYVIITTTDIATAISSSDFLTWKQALGYTVKIVNITDPEITRQPGHDLAERIRNFLRANYLDWGIVYVLIIGDSATIPMRYCYPDKTNHENTAGTPGGSGGEVPTDYYYADLSNTDDESWDYDGDGFYGEYGQDHPDFLPEIFVGRIPINDLSRIQYTLEKTITFEQDTSEWKSHALHAGAFYYFTGELGADLPLMDGAIGPAQIENDIMHGWTISHYSEQDGLESSVYDWNPLSETAFTSDWRTGQYAIVNWDAHGWSNAIARKVWERDDGDDIPEANEMSWPPLLNIASNLDDDYPAIVTSISCLVGYPEPNGWGNLGIDLLTMPSFGASVGVVASARSPYGDFDWPLVPGGSDSIIYEFNKNIITNDQKVGEALYTSKYFCNLNYGWSLYFEYINLYTFNLYGDPSLAQQGINISGRPNKPSTPTGETSGKNGVEYQYTSSAIDPNDDPVYYLFNWGDGTDSGWLGPVDSGALYQANHIWQKKGSYEIKTRVKDGDGLVSDWSDPIAVTMPLISNFINKPFLTWLFEHHPCAFPILRYFLGYEDITLKKIIAPSSLNMV
jgi:hypothetical protein